MGKPGMPALDQAVDRLLQCRQRGLHLLAHLFGYHFLDGSLAGLSTFLVGTMPDLLRFLMCLSQDFACLLVHLGQIALSLAGKVFEVEGRRVRQTSQLCFDDRSHVLPCRFLSQSRRFRCLLLQSSRQVEELVLGGFHVA